MENKRDRQRQQFLKKEGKSGQELPDITQAQSEIYGIQSELQNNLQTQRLIKNGKIKNRQLLQQSAGIIGQQAVDQQPLQPPIKTDLEILKKYGISPGQKSSSSSKIQVNQGPTKIENKYINTTKNDIKIVQPQIPVSNNNIKHSGGTIERFRAWLSGIFSQQQVEDEKDRKEFNRREWSLQRAANKMLEKMSTLSRGFAEKINPQNMGSTIFNQIKLFGAMFLTYMTAKYWTPLMKTLENLHAGVLVALGQPLPPGMSRTGVKGISIVDNIKRFLGIDVDHGEQTTLIGGIGVLLKEGTRKLLDGLDLILKDRAEALKTIKLPEIELPTIGIGPIDNILQGLNGLVQSGVGYLGDILTTMMGGSKGAVKTAARKIYSQGASDLVKNSRGEGLSRSGNYDVFGNLKNDSNSTFLASQAVNRALNDKSNTAYTGAVASGISQLSRVADTNGSVVVSKDFLMQAGFGPYIEKLLRTGDIKSEQMKVIQVRKGYEDIENTSGAHTFQSIGRIAGTVGAAASNFLPGFGWPALVQLAVNDTTGTIAGAAIDEAVRDNYKKKLVPIDSPETSEDGSKPEIVSVYRINKRAFNQLKQAVGVNQFSVEDPEFMKFVNSVVINKKRQNGINSDLVLDQQENFDSYADTDVRYKQYQQKIDNWRTGAGEYAGRYDHFNRFTQNLGGAIQTAGSYVTNVVGSLVSGGGKGRVSTDELRRRVNYCMKFFTDRGLSKESAAGIVGNLLSEGLFTKDLGHEYEDNGGPSAGIAGFHDPRGKVGELSKLKQYAQINGKDWKSLDTQLNYLWEASGAHDSNIFEKIQNATSGLSGTEALSKASYIWGHDYERFAGYNSAEGEGNYKNRLQKSADALATFDSNSSIIGIPGDYSDRGGLPKEIWWLGDSQTAGVNGKLPKTVGQRLGTKICYFGRASANALHYLGKADEKNLGGPVTNMGVSTCSDAFNKTLSEGPSIVIVALGHNGTNGLSNLTQALSQKSKVILIKMWPTHASAASGMKSLSTEELRSMYSGISAFGFVDLTNLPMYEQKMLSNDGVHATASGYEYAAQAIVEQLHGKLPISQIPGEINDASVNDFSTAAGNVAEQVVDSIGGAIDKIGNWVSWMGGDPTAYNPFSSSTIQAKESRAQQIIRESKENFMMRAYGAKKDAGGLYLQRGNSKVYLKPGTTSTTLTADDVYAVNVRKDENNNWKEPKTDKERLDAIDEVLSDVDDLYTYVGKNTPSDVLRRADGKPAIFDLGYFHDIDGYGEQAREIYAETGIHIQVSFSKDGKRLRRILTDRVKINLTGSLSDNIGLYKDGLNLGSVSKSNKNKYTYTSIYLYQKGGFRGPGNKIYDWNPLYTMIGVTGLTPKAQYEVDALLRILQNAETVKTGGKEFVASIKGKYYGGYLPNVKLVNRTTGQPFSKEDSKVAAKAGLVVNGFNSSLLGGENSDILGSLKNFQNQVSIDTVKKFLGISDISKIEEDFKANPEKYQVVNDSVYDKLSGIKIGTLNDKKKFIGYSENQIKKWIESNPDMDSIKRMIQESAMRQAYTDSGQFDPTRITDLYSPTAKDKLYNIKNSKYSSYVDALGKEDFILEAVPINGVLMDLKISPDGSKLKGIKYHFGTDNLGNSTIQYSNGRQEMVPYMLSNIKEDEWIDPNKAVSYIKKPNETGSSGANRDAYFKASGLTFKDIQGLIGQINNGKDISDNEDINRRLASARLETIIGADIANDVNFEKTLQRYQEQFRNGDTSSFTSSADGNGLIWSEDGIAIGKMSSNGIEFFNKEQAAAETASWTVGSKADKTLYYFKKYGAIRDSDTGELVIESEIEGRRFRAIIDESVPQDSPKFIKEFKAYNGGKWLTEKEEIDYFKKSQEKAEYSIGDGSFIENQFNKARNEILGNAENKTTQEKIFDAITLRSKNDWMTYLNELDAYNDQFKTPEERAKEDEEWAQYLQEQANDVHQIAAAYDSSLGAIATVEVDDDPKNRKKAIVEKFKAKAEEKGWKIDDKNYKRLMADYIQKYDLTNEDLVEVLGDLKNVISKDQVHNSEDDVKNDSTRPEYATNPGEFSMWGGSEVRAEDPGEFNPKETSYFDWLNKKQEYEKKKGIINKITPKKSGQATNTLFGITDNIPVKDSDQTEAIKSLKDSVDASKSATNAQLEESRNYWIWQSEAMRISEANRHSDAVAAAKGTLKEDDSFTQNQQMKEYSSSSANGY